MNPKSRLGVLILFLLPLFSVAQVMEDPDSNMRKSAYELFENINLQKPVDTLSPRIVFLGNKECGHCQEMHKVFDEAGIVYETYDVMKDQRFFRLIIDYFNKRSNGQGFGVSYPVILAQGKVYENIKDAKAFALTMKETQLKLRR